MVSAGPETAFREVAAVDEGSTEPSLTMDSDWYFRQEQFESLRRDYLDADRALRDHAQYTDRQLRELNKERKAFALELQMEYRFDAASDTFDVDLNDKTSITVPRQGFRRDEPPRPLSRKDKRRQKTEHRKAVRFFREFDARVRRNPA